MRHHQSHQFKYQRKLYMAAVNSEIEMELIITLLGHANLPHPLL